MYDIWKQVAEGMGYTRKHVWFVDKMTLNFITNSCNFFLALPNPQFRPENKVDLWNELKIISKSAFYLSGFEFASGLLAKCQLERTVADESKPLS